MSKLRTIKKTYKGKESIDGAGVKLRRIFGYHEVPELDPFLLLDFFNSTDPNDYIKGFPWHPHRGIETVTYFIQGEVEHGDSLGNKGVIRSGDCQWMTAGSGIIHQEMPKESPLMLGVQLWVNLPRKNKMIDPKYRDITKYKIPVIEEKEAIIKIIAGNYKSHMGPVIGANVSPTFLDISIKENEEFIYETDTYSTVFVLVVDGKGIFDDEGVIESVGIGILYNPGHKIIVKAKEEGVRFLLFSGKPLEEPIAWGGPIVMNTKEELDLAFKELKENAFIKSK